MPVLDRPSWSGGPEGLKRNYRGSVDFIDLPRTLVLAHSSFHVPCAGPITRC